MGLLKSTLNDWVVAFTMNDVRKDPSGNEFNEFAAEYFSTTAGLLDAAQKEAIEEEKGTGSKRHKRDSLFIDACNKYLRVEYQVDEKYFTPSFIIGATFCCSAVIAAAFLAIVIYMLFQFPDSWINTESIISLVVWSAVRAVIVLVVYISLFRTVYGLLFQPPSGSDEQDNDGGAGFVGLR